jgi:hypothetical protein
MQQQQRSYFDEQGTVMFTLNIHFSFFFNKNIQKTMINIF